MVDFTQEDCQYEIGGNPWTVNYNLAVASKLDKDTVQKIISYHKRRYDINRLAALEPINSSRLDTFRRVLDGFEFHLQRLWRFPLDDRFHPHQRIGV